MHTNVYAVYARSCSLSLNVFSVVVHTIRAACKPCSGDGKGELIITIYFIGMCHPNIFFYTTRDDEKLGMTRCTSLKGNLRILPFSLKTPWYFSEPLLDRCAICDVLLVRYCQRQGWGWLGMGTPKHLTVF